jgi:hypothetical protein
MNLQELTLAHEPDVAWIVALWLAIHGGDPGPEAAVEIDETTALLATALSARLAEKHGLGPVTHETLQERFGCVVAPAHETEAPAKHFPPIPEALSCVRLPLGPDGELVYFCWPFGQVPVNV